jgi:hypothetical protein
VKCIPIAKQRVGKHIPARANAGNNTTSITRQRISKHPSLTIEAVFSVASVQSDYSEVVGSIEQDRTEVVESNRIEFETPACQDMNLGAWKWIESSLRNWRLQNNGKKEIRL